jgi:hypothetical protein
LARLFARLGITREAWLISIVQVCSRGCTIALASPQIWHRFFQPQLFAKVHAADKEASFPISKVPAAPNLSHARILRSLTGRRPRLIPRVGALAGYPPESLSRTFNPQASLHPFLVLKKLPSAVGTHWTGRKPVLYFFCAPSRDRRSTPRNGIPVQPPAYVYFGPMPRAKNTGFSFVSRHPGLARNPCWPTRPIDRLGMFKRQSAPSPEYSFPYKIK